MDVPEIVEASDLVSSDVQLIDLLSELQKKKKLIEEKIEFIKEELVTIAKNKKTDTLIGTKMRASIKEYLKVVYPDETKDVILRKLKERGIYDDFVQLNRFKLTPKIMKNEIDSEIIDLVRKELAYRVSLIPL